MKIIISNQSELPIYAQIVSQIREQILKGEIPEGTVLPSIRKLAAEVGVSVITTTRAYSDLEKEGFIASIQGKGSVVLPQDNDLLRERQNKRIEDALITAVETAKNAQMDKKDLDALLSIIWENSK